MTHTVEGGSDKYTMEFDAFFKKYTREHSQKNSVLTDDLAYQVLSVVSEIPEGKVATYGQIARLIGREKNSRLVGKILSHAELYGDYPCHRVVNHAGRMVPGWPEQRQLLEEEGIPFKADGNVDLKQCQWDQV